MERESEGQIDFKSQETGCKGVEEVYNRIKQES